MSQTREIPAPLRANPPTSQPAGGEDAMREQDKLFCEALIDCLDVADMQKVLAYILKRRDAARAVGGGREMSTPLAERLGALVAKWRERAAAGIVGDGIALGYGDCATELEALAAAGQEGWLPIESATPEAPFDVLIVESGNVWLGYCMDGRWWRCANSGAERAYPSHWQPLPPQLANLGADGGREPE